MQTCEDAELVFENDIYVISVKILPGEVLRVEAEHKSDGALWRGDFTSGYIEDITRKTGNCKKFSIFVKMLRSAILQDSDSVFVSLLTYYELEVLKARKTNAAQIPRDLANNKRYLILTYVGEFDRVHYPLPLLYEDTPEPENLRRTIQRLKAEMAELKVKLLERPNNDYSEGRKQQQDSECDYYDEVNGNCKQAESRFEVEKAHLIKENLAWKNKYKVLLSKYEAKKECHKESQIWRRKLEQLQEELRKERSSHKKAVANLMLEKVALLEEVKQSRNGETRARVKLRESESELEHLKRKIKATSTRDLPSSRTRTRPSGATTNSRRPSPTTKGYRSSSCPTFGARTTSCRDQGARQTAYGEHLLPRVFPRNGRRSPQPFVNPTRRNCGSGRSSCSERSTTPPLQCTVDRLSPRSASCGASPGKSWKSKLDLNSLQNDVRMGKVLPNGDIESKRIRKERPRDESPGKLLKDVKEKLAKYAVMEGLDCSERSSLVSATTCNEAEDDETAMDVSNQQSAAVDDIEARIEALQKFLQCSKTK